MNTILNRLEKVVGIQRQEFPKVIKLFLLFLLVITAFWVQKPIRTSKFLSNVGVEFLPLVKLGSAFIVVPVMLLYSYLVRKFCRECMVVGCVCLFILCSLVFWQAFSHRPPDWIHYVYFFYIDIYITVMVTLFWSFSNDITPPEQARRIYGFVGAGGIIGGIIGSSTTGWLVERVGSSTLLLICAGILACILPITMWIMKGCPQTTPSIRKDQRLGSWKSALNGTKLTFTNRYLLSIAALVVCYEMSSNLIDYQFSTIAASYFPIERTLTSFLGKLSSGMNILSVFLQILFTTWILRRFGPQVGIFILPVVLGVGSLVLAAVPLFIVSTLLYGSDGSLHYSINQTSKEVLYTPTDEAAKYQSKAFIDMFLFRFAKGLSAFLIVCITFWLFPGEWPAHYFSWLTLVFIVLWLIAARFAGKQFVRLSQTSQR